MCLLVSHGPYFGLGTLIAALFERIGAPIMLELTFPKPTSPSRTAAMSLLLLTAVALGASGCVRVRPYERSILSSRVMKPGSDAAEAKLDGHVHEYREAAIGGGGVSGGGCGCN